MKKIFGLADNIVALFGLRRQVLSLLIAIALAPACLTATNLWRFAVIAETRGDGTNTPGKSWVQTSTMLAMSQAIVAEQPSLVLVAGDMVHGICAELPPIGTNIGAQYALWTNAFAPIYLAQIPVRPIRGAREAAAPDSVPAFLAAFSNALPHNGPAGEKGLTYSFRQNNAFFIGLDQFRASHQINQEWLDAQLAQNSLPHIFVFGYEPAVQVASADCLAVNRAARNKFLDSMSGAGARLYFCSRDAFYNRAEIKTASGKTLQQVLVGTGGAPATTNWSGVYGRNFGESGLASKARHIERTNGYTLVTVSNLTVIVEWKGSSNGVVWKTMDSYCYTIPNPALNRINDYDGDRKADPALYDAENGIWNVLFSGNAYHSGAFALGGPGARPVPGDYDGDGKTDVAVYEKNGVWTVLLSDSAYAKTITYFGGPYMGPVAADYDGDGKTDIACYEKRSGVWSILMSGNNNAPVSMQWGGSGTMPIPADYDGDGKADLALYRRTTGEWQVLLSSLGYAGVSLLFGGSDDMPIPADYDNDRKADPAVYNRLTGEWQVLLSSLGYARAALIFGNSQYKALAGDYDGDGKNDLAIHANLLQEWQILLSGSNYEGAELIFGGANWTLTAARWQEALKFTAFGDSITYGSGSSDEQTCNYPTLLEKQLNLMFEGAFRAVNKGVPGEDTYDGIERLLDVLNETQPDLLLLMEGTNDHFCGYPFSEIEENLRNMIRIALGRGIPVIIATIPPVISNQYRERSAQQARIVSFNPRIYRIAADFNIPVARVYEAITSVPGWQQNLMHQESANHPNDAGYLRMRDAFYAAVFAGLEAGMFP